MPGTNVEEIPEVEAIASYESLKELLDDLPTDGLRSLRFTANEAASRGLWLAGNAQRDGAKFVAMYANPPLAEIESIKQRALAVKGAELLATKTGQTLEQPDIAGARIIRKRHLKIVDAVVGETPDNMQQIADIIQGRGTRDLGSDLIDLAALERANWSAIVATGLVQEADLEQMDQLGVQILAWAGRSGEGTPDTNPRGAEQRAWTYMATAYQIIRDYAQVIYRDDPDTWRRDYPSLFTHEGPTKPK
jgi:hypothetical protein